MLNNQLNVLESKFQLIDIEAEFQNSERDSGLSDLSGKKVIFRTDFAKECLALQSLGDSSSSRIQYEQREFSSEPHNHAVAAVDSSCILIGETEEGAIYSGRVATVLARDRKIATYCRAGPVIFYITPRTVRTILGSSFYSKIANVILMDKNAAERFIRIHLERTALLSIARKVMDSIVLVDGALRSSVFERMKDSFKQLEKTCEEQGNQLTGFSKSSTLKVVTGAATSLQASTEGSRFIDLTESLRAIFPLISRGDNRIVVAKFSQSSPVLRVDFSSLNSEDPAQILCDLKYDDSLFRGYPETLRLAHHLSVFDSSAVSSIRSYLSRNYGLIRVPSDDLRSTILGKLV